MKANTTLMLSLLTIMCVSGACSSSESSNRQEPLGAANRPSPGGRSGTIDVDCLVRDAAAELEAGRLKIADRLLEKALAIEPENTTKARYYLDLVKQAIEYNQNNPDSAKFWYPTLPPRQASR